MKAISLWQPWASAMALGLKAIETRHWSTNVRGLVAIHAAKRWTGGEREFARALAHSLDCPTLADPPLGAVVAVGFLRSVHRSEALIGKITDTEEMLGNYEPGRFGWTFEDVTALPSPIPFRGAQGFFDIPDALIGQCGEVAERGLDHQLPLFGVGS